MQTGAQAYYKTATATMSPRELEASLLLKAAGRLQLVQDRWAQGTDDLNPALDYDRRLWTILLSAIAEQDNPIPDDIRQNVSNIGIFILHRITEVMAAPSPDKLTALVHLNRQLAAGLRSPG